MFFNLYISHLLLRLGLSQYDFLPICSNSSSGCRCDQTETYYTKFQQPNSKYACNGDKCLQTTSFSFLGVSLVACKKCVNGYKASGFLYCDINFASSGSCQQTEFLDNNVCYNCMDNCQVCQNSLSCDICKDGYFYNQQSTLNSCSLCSSKCAKCLTTENNCTECSTEREKLELNCVCKSGYYEDSNNQCIQCNLPCIKCQSNVICDECQQIPELYLNINKICQCQDNYFYQETSQNCQICNSTCETCITFNYHCLSCYTQQHRILQNNQCICQDGYFEDSNNQCIQCKLPCLKCLSNLNCQQCESHPLIYLNNNNFCLCQDSYYYSDITKNCEFCDSTCKTCTTFGHYCLSCYYEQNRILENNKCICKDDYFEDSNNKCVSCKLESALTIQKCKYSNCKDNVWSFGEQCDDGNQQKRDGCYNCQIEESFFCINQISQPSQCFRCPDNCINCKFQNNETLCLNAQNGYFVDNQIYIQKCNEKCLNCKEYASNCSQCKYLNIGKTNINCQFCEYKKGYYTNYETLQCFTKCGDGVLADIEQCDDGNLQNGDGCNNKCQLEQKFNCKNDLCIKQISPYLIINYNPKNDLYDSIRQVQVYYDQLLNLNEDFNIKNYITLEIIDKQSQQIVSEITLKQNFIFNSINGSNLSFIIQCVFNQSVENIQLQINYTQPIQIKNMNNVLQDIENIKVKLNDITIINENVKIITEGAISSTNYLIYYLIGLIICGVLFGGLDIYYNLLDTIQNFSYLYYINVEFPYNLEQFFSNLKFAQFTFVQDFIDLKYFYQSYFNINYEEDEKFIPLKLKDEGYSSFFIINFASIFSVFATSFILYIFSLIFMELEKIKKSEWLIFASSSKIRKLISNCFYFVNLQLFIYSKWMKQQFIYSGLLRVFMASANEFCFSLQLGIKGLGISNNFQTVNSIFTLTFLALYVFGTITSISLMQQKNYSVKCQSVIFRFGSLFEGVALHKFSLAFNPLLMIKKFLYMLFLIQLYEYSVHQTLQVFLLSLFFLTYLLIYSPLEDRLELRKTIICELQQTISLLLFTLLCINQQLMMISYQYQLIIGWVIIGNFLIALAIQVIIDSMQQFKFMYQKSKFIKNLIDNLIKRFQKQESPKPTPKIFVG